MNSRLRIIRVAIYDLRNPPENADLKSALLIIADALAAIEEELCCVQPPST